MTVGSHNLLMQDSSRAARAPGPSLCGWPLRLFAMAYLTACGQGDAPPVSNGTPTLSKITVRLSSDSMAAGSTAIATATGSDQFGNAIATGSISWTSQAPAIATIQASGTIQAIAVGQTFIVAEAGGKRAQAMLTVVLPTQERQDGFVGNSGTTVLKFASGSSVTFEPIATAGTLVSVSVTEVRPVVTGAPVDAGSRFSVIVGPGTSDTLRLAAKYALGAPLPAGFRLIGVWQPDGLADRVRWITPTIVSGSTSPLGVAGVTGMSESPSMLIDLQIVPPSTGTIGVIAIPSTVERVFGPCSAAYDWQTKQPPGPGVGAGKTIILIHGLALDRMCDFAYFEDDESKARANFSRYDWSTFDPDVVTWSATRTALAAAFPGARIVEIRYPTNQRLEDAGTYVQQQLDLLGAAVAENSVLLIGYSQGGLVSRVVDRLETKSRIGGIITIATPHNGTPAATLGSAIREHFPPGAGVDQLATSVFNGGTSSFTTIAPLWSAAGGVACNSAENSLYWGVKYLCRVYGAGLLTPAVVSDGIVPTASALPDNARETFQPVIIQNGIDHFSVTREASTIAWVVATARAVVAPVRPVGFVQIAAGSSHACGLSETGEAYCWGRNGSGQLGNGSATSRSTPTLVTGGLRFRQIVAGSSHTCALTMTGVPYCWGSGQYGALGDGTTSSRVVPTQVIGGHTFSQMIAGESYTCGLKPTKVAYCWGLNNYGTLGRGSAGGFTPNPVPSAVVGGIQFAQLAGGLLHVCARTEIDQLYCWGNAQHGQTGDGNSSDIDPRAAPTLVAGGIRFVEVSTGNLTSCGRAINNSVYCWGWGGRGSVGDGSGLNRYSPSPVAGSLTFSSLSRGSGVQCGSSSVNSYCWGFSVNGNIGDGSTIDRPVPTTVVGGPFVEIASGGTVTCGRKATNVVYCWGQNSFGEVGDGTTESRLVPTRVLTP